MSVRARSGGEMDAGLKGVNGRMSAHVAWVGAVFGVCRGGGGVVVERRRGTLGKRKKKNHWLPRWQTEFHNQPKMKP